ncbi:Type II secretion system protein G precursor [Lactococcus garvieae]|nr:Type II secretion system protein G precursor [Lactococcus garvieae]
MKKKRLKAFTLIEMLVVLLIISVLLLLFVPNLAKEKKNIQNTGQTAVVKVVEGQAELYQLDKQDSPNLGKLVSDGLITQKQADSYNDYYTKNPNAKRNVPNYSFDLTREFTSPFPLLFCSFSLFRFGQTKCQDSTRRDFYFTI